MYVNHILREHSQEAGHWAKLADDGTKRIVVEKGGGNERWKAVIGYWGGSIKETWLWRDYQSC